MDSPICHARFMFDDDGRIWHSTGECLGVKDGEELKKGHCASAECLVCRMSQGRVGRARIDQGPTSHPRSDNNGSSSLLYRDFMPRKWEIVDAFEPFETQTYKKAVVKQHGSYFMLLHSKNRSMAIGYR